MVVWLPNPDMRLKVARVLVDDGENVAPLERVSPAGDHIVQQHHDLWAVSVYADPEVADDPHVAEAALISLKTDMDIGLVTRDGERVQTRAEALVNLIGNRVGMNDDDRAELRLLVNEEFQAVAAGGRPTFRQMARAVWSIARINGLGGVQGRPPADLW